MTAITFDATGKIVVGTDLSRRAGAAVDWAAELSAARGWPLLIVAALPEVPIPRRSRMFDALATGDWPAHLRDAADHKLKELRTRVLATHPEVDVAVHVELGRPSWVLAQASKTARVVVVGARGEHAPATVRALGGTADAVVAHAHGPVAVVTDLAHEVPNGPVVVGVDDSPEGHAALRLAGREAAARGVPLVAIHAWDLSPWMIGPMGGAGMVDPIPLQRALTEMVDEFLAPIREEHPGLETRAKVVEGRPSTALVGASETAGLVVVGARGLGGFAGLLLGSTSREVLRDAHCPVIVTRADDRVVAH